MKDIIYIVERYIAVYAFFMSVPQITIITIVIFTEIYQRTLSRRFSGFR